MEDNSTLNILIVDDDEDCLDGYLIALKPTKYKCTVANDPLSAFELYKKNKFDVVISDLTMSGMSGFELLKKIKKYDKKARVIIISGWKDFNVERNAVINLVYAYLFKPFTLGDFISIFKEIEKEILRE